MPDCAHLVEQLIYEWEQSLDEVNIYITPPPGVGAAQFDVEIKSEHLMVGIKGNPERYLNVCGPLPVGICGGLTPYSAGSCRIQCSLTGILLLCSFQS